LKLVVLPAAEADLSDAVDHYIEEATAQVAADLQREVKRVAALLAELPGLGHKVSPTARAFGLKRFPYNLVYRVTKDTVLIVAVAHQRRDPGFWQER
jgi:toxin ParE1/3/4